MGITSNNDVDISMTNGLAPSNNARYNDLLLSPTIIFGPTLGENSALSAIKQQPFPGPEPAPPRFFFCPPEETHSGGGEREITAQ